MRRSSSGLARALSCCAAILLAGAAIAWSADKFTADKFSPKGLNPTDAPDKSGVPDEELLPPIKITIRSEKGMIGSIYMGDRLIPNLQELRGSIMGMVGPSGEQAPQGLSRGFEIDLAADSDLKASELLKVIDAVGGYRNREGKYIRLIHFVRARLDRRDLKPGKHPQMERTVQILKIEGGN